MSFFSIYRAYKKCVSHCKQNKYCLRNCWTIYDCRNVIHLEVAPLKQHSSEMCWQQNVNTSVSYILMFLQL